MKKFFLYCGMIGIFACTPIAKTAYGIKKPRLENRNSVRAYLLRQAVDTSAVYSFRDLKSFAIASQQGLLNIPEAMFFNKDGYLVRYKKEAVDCNANVDGFITDLSAFSKIEPDWSVTMDSFRSLLDAPEKTESNAEVNVFITWTVYAGKLNKEKAFEWIRLLDIAKKKGMSVKYYLVNCDYMRNWNISKPLQERLGIKN